LEVWQRSGAEKKSLRQHLGGVVPLTSIRCQSQFGNKHGQMASSSRQEKAFSHS